MTFVKFTQVCCIVNLTILFLRVVSYVTYIQTVTYMYKHLSDIMQHETVYTTKMPLCAFCMYVTVVVITNIMLFHTYNCCCCCFVVLFAIAIAYITDTRVSILLLFKLVIQFVLHAKLNRLQFVYCNFMLRISYVGKC